MTTSSNRDAANAIATSESHPIQVGEIPIGGGILGMTFCPGKHDTGRHGMVWQRNLPMDLDALQQWGAGTLVTLMEPHELNTVRVPNLAQEVRERGISWHCLPIVDQSVPDATLLDAWTDLSKVLRAELADGHKIILHCRGGLGRTGLVGALLMIDLGLSAEEAILRVRKARSSRAIETREQEDYVRRYATRTLG